MTENAFVTPTQANRAGHEPSTHFTSTQVQHRPAHRLGILCRSGDQSPRPKSALLDHSTINGKIPCQPTAARPDRILHDNLLCYPTKEHRLSMFVAMWLIPKRTRKSLKSSDSLLPTCPHKGVCDGWAQAQSFFPRCRRNELTALVLEFEEPTRPNAQPTAANSRRGLKPFRRRQSKAPTRNS